MSRPSRRSTEGQKDWLNFDMACSGIRGLVPTARFIRAAYQPNASPGRKLDTAFVHESNRPHFYRACRLRIDLLPGAPVRQPHCNAARRIGTLVGVAAVRVGFVVSCEVEDVVLLAGSAFREMSDLRHGAPFARCERADDRPVVAA